MAYVLPPEDPFRFRKLYDAFLGVPNPQQCEKEIRDVGVAFVRNMLRTMNGIWLFPILCRSLVFSYALAVDANLAIANQARITMPEIERRGLTELWNQKYSELVNEARIKPRTAADDAHDFNEGAIVFGNLLNSVPPTSNVGQGVESILAMVVIQSWTAFEVLSEDLWVTTLNARYRLGLIALNAEPDPSDEVQEQDRKRNVKFQVPAHLFDAAKGNLGSEMGKILNSKWDFANKYEAEEAYRKVFNGNEEKIKSIFQNENLRWLAALRNVVVHSAGKADREFLKLVRKHPMLSNAREGEFVRLDGELIAPLIGAAVSCGRELLEFVNQWLHDNPS